MACGRGAAHSWERHVNSLAVYISMGGHVLSNFRSLAFLALVHFSKSSFVLVVVQSLLGNLSRGLCFEIESRRV